MNRVVVHVGKKKLYKVTHEPYIPEVDHFTFKGTELKIISRYYDLFNEEAVVEITPRYSEIVIEDEFIRLLLNSFFKECK